MTTRRRRRVWRYRVEPTRTYGGGETRLLEDGRTIAHFRFKRDAERIARRLNQREGQ